MLCLKAHAKINWTLDIHGTRADGYHLMEMLMQTVEMHDTLWLEEADDLILENAADETGAPVEHPSDGLASEAVTYDQKNLVYRAARLLQERYQVKRGARMRLLKKIPSGAGMGGGSADAAAALRGLNELWNLQIPQEELLRLGLSLGADVPFMLTGGLAHVSGIGEVIRPLAPAPEIWLVMLQPCGGLSTREVFTAFDSLSPALLSRPQTATAEKALLECDLLSLSSAMNNVLEGVSAAARPALRKAVRALEEYGALRGMMTGSGSVVYGVFESEEKARKAALDMRDEALLKGWGDIWVTRSVK